MAIKTPCINVCILDDAAGLCRGCGRTGDEIAAWTAIDARDRDRIMAELPARLARAWPARRTAGG